MSIRPVKRLVKAKPTLEGAGVHLRRAFGFGNTSDFDPFLLLDDFRNDVPEDYLAGFPWHPHRGIETITYVLAGTVEHGDSMGNRGAIAAGDVQWMTAGSGIIHQEMPKGDHAGPDARIPAVGEPSGVAQDDRAALPGSEGAPRSPRSRMTTARRFASFAEVSGARRVPWTASPPIRSTSMCRFLPDGRRPFRSRRPATPSPMSSPGPGNSATPPSRSLCRPKRRMAGYSASLGGGQPLAGTV